MNIFRLLLISILLISCKLSDEEARKPIAKKESQDILAPIKENIIAHSVLYEANIRQYSIEGTFNAFAKDLPILKKMGVKIIWLMPINPISNKKSKGPLGSYYAVSNHTKVNPDFGTLEDFKALVKKAHALGIYVILDWALEYTGWDHNWVKQNNTFYLKNRNGEIINPINSQKEKLSDLTDLAALNFNNLEMREAMRQAMIYWVKEVNIDGYRIDKAYTVPQEFYNNTITALKEVKPLFFIGDTGIYNQGGLELVSKFDATYDWSGYLISKDIAQGKRKAYDYSRHINKTIKRYDADNTLVNFISNHSENSWNGTVKESYGNADHTFMALNFTIPGMPLVYSGQEYDLNKRLHFFEKDSFPKKVGKTMHLIQQLGALKNNHRALASGKKRGSYKKVQTSKTNQIYAFERGKDGDTLVVIANLSKEYAQFTMPLNGIYRRYQDYKTKQLSSTYQYYLKPWEFWILIK